MDCDVKLDIRREDRDAQRTRPHLCQVEKPVNVFDRTVCGKANLSHKFRFLNYAFGYAQMKHKGSFRQHKFAANPRAAAAHCCSAAIIEKVLFYSTALVCCTRMRQTHILWMGLKLEPWSRVANSLLRQELKLCFSDTKFTKAPCTKKYTSFFSRY